ncbi:MAG: hypothetical protein J6F30_04030 [Cellulosilyticum sp.]|nr:hypothetical protein [Cellulosilyticum sp.]
MYCVKVHFDENAKENMKDKIKPSNYSKVEARLYLML